MIPRVITGQCGLIPMPISFVGTEHRVNRIIRNKTRYVCSDRHSNIAVLSLWVLFNAERHSLSGFCVIVAIHWAKSSPRLLSRMTVFAVNSARTCSRWSHLYHGKILKVYLKDWVHQGNSVGFAEEACRARTDESPCYIPHEWTQLHVPTIRREHLCFSAARYS